MYGTQGMQMAYLLRFSMTSPPLSALCPAAEKFLHDFSEIMGNEEEGKYEKIKKLTLEAESSWFVKLEKELEKMKVSIADFTENMESEKVDPNVDVVETTEKEDGKQYKSVPFITKLVSRLSLPPRPPHETSKNEFFMYFLIFFCSLPFYLSITYSEWYIDELFAITRNEDARGVTPFWSVLEHDFWGNHMWAEGSWTHKSYRPIVILTYWFQYIINDFFLKPQPLRVFNCLLNSLTSLLLGGVLHRGFRFSWKWAALAAGMFAMHPVHTENVVYLVGRADVLAAFFWLLCMCLYWTIQYRFKTRVAQAGAFLFCVLVAIASGLSKEPGFTVFAWFVVSEFFPLNRSVPSSSFKSSSRRIVCILVAFLLVFRGRSWLVGGTGVAFSYVDTPIPYIQPWQSRALSFLHVHWVYLRLLVLPWNLAWDYSYDAIPVLRIESALTDLRMLGVACCYLALLSSIYLALGRAVVWKLSEKKENDGEETGEEKNEDEEMDYFPLDSRPLHGIALILLPFLPASNLFFTVGTVVGERLLYISSIGWAVLIAWLGEYSDGRTEGRDRPGLEKKGGRRLLKTSLLALGLFYFYNCIHRTRLWRSRIALFGTDAMVWPRSVKTLHQFATTLHRADHLKEAMQLYEASLAIFDDNALTDYCVAQILVEQNKFEQALQRFEKIAKGNGIGFGGFNRFLLHCDHGFALSAVGRHEEAIHHFQIGLALNEDVPHALNSYGMSLAYLGRPDEAIEVFKTGLKYDPTNPWILSNLSAAIIVKGDPSMMEQALYIAIDAINHSQKELGAAHPKFVMNYQILDSLLTGQPLPENAMPQMEMFFHRML